VFRYVNMQRFALPLAIMVALVAVVLPTCQMVGCDMNGMTAMPFMPQGGAFTDCPGQWVVNTSGSNGIVPSGLDSLTFSLLIALLAIVGALFFAPQRRLPSGWPRSTPATRHRRSKTPSERVSGSRISSLPLTGRASRMP